MFAAGERVLIFTHFAEWGQKLAAHLTEVTGTPVECYHGGLSRTARDRMIQDFQTGVGPGALVLSLKAGGTGLNLTAANHVVLYDRWWNPAVEDQARDRAWRIGQTHTVISHRLVCPGTVDERVEEVVAGKRRIARPRPPEVELARRPRHRAAPDRARHPSRHRARRGSRAVRGPKPHEHAPPPQGSASRTGVSTPGPSRSRDFWGPDLAEQSTTTPTPIRPSDHPTALIESLGTPPFPDGEVAQHYFDAVYERAAALAIALATSAGLSETPEPD